MTKKIRQAILFLLLLLAFIYAVQYAVGLAYRQRVSNKFTGLLKHKTDANIMIFGSSVAYHQFDPAVIKSVTGLSAYNMGWPGMFFVQYNGLLTEYLSYEQQCKLLVIACDFDNLGRNQLITRPDLFWAWLCNRNIYNALHELEPQKVMLAKYVPGYKLTLLNKAFYTDILLAAHRKDSLSGYEPLNTPWEQMDTIKPFNARYDESVFLQLKSALNGITAKGIKVVLVIPPVYEQGYKLIQNAEMIKSKYASLAGRDVFFLDYTSDSLCKTKSYFRNFTHLNGIGATLFSRTFAQDLLKLIHE